MAVCVECDAENSDEAEFCSSCGAKLVKPESLPSDTDNPFGLPNWGGRYPLFHTPTRVLPRRVRERLTSEIFKALLWPFVLAMVLLYLLVHAVLSGSGAAN